MKTEAAKKVRHHMATQMNRKMRWRVAVALTFMPALSACSYFSPVVTNSEYRKVEPGMSYSQVSAIIGDKGKQSGWAEVVTGGILLRVEDYRWQNGNGSYMLATFENHKLTKKSESWLR